MSYSYPAYDEADASFDGASEYVYPDFDGADVDWVPPDQVFTYASAPTMLGAQEVLADAPAAAVVSDPGPLRQPRVVGNVIPAGIVSIPSPLVARVTAFHDFTVAIPATAITYYYADFETPSGTVRIPISSWQATLQVGVESYVQCVVPAAAAWADTLEVATSFQIVRGVTLQDGAVIEQVLADAPLQTLALAQGTSNYSATISGYSDAFTEQEDIDAIYDRRLTGVRTVFTYPQSLRVRCAIDWILRPGQRAIVDDETTITVAFMNYYVGRGDAYMDVGNRNTG